MRHHGRDCSRQKLQRESKRWEKTRSKARNDATAKASQSASSSLVRSERTQGESIAVKAPLPAARPVRRRNG
jgi:hypothetical protein